MVTSEGNRALLYDKVKPREDFNTGKNWADLYVEGKEGIGKKGKI